MYIIYSLRQKDSTDLFRMAGYLGSLTSHSLTCLFYIFHVGYPIYHHKQPTGSVYWNYTDAPFYEGEVIKNLRLHGFIACKWPVWI